MKNSYQALFKLVTDLSFYFLKTMLTQEYMQRRIDHRDKIRLKHVRAFIDNKPPRTMDESVRLRKKKQDLDSMNI